MLHYMDALTANFSCTIYRSLYIKSLKFYNLVKSVIDCLQFK